jgi:hypothetical protein
LSLIAAGVVLCRYKNQPGFRGREPWQRGLTKRIQDANDNAISGSDTNSNRSHNRNAENERHEERNHNQPPLFFLTATRAKLATIRCRENNFRLHGFFNLLTLTRVASDDPDSPRQPRPVVKYGVELCTPNFEQFCRPVDITEGQSSPYFRHH